MISEQAWLYGQMEPGENLPLQANPVHIDNVLKKIQHESTLNYYKMEFGIWKVGNHPSTVVSDVKVRNTNFPTPLNASESTYDDREHYGGYLVAESIGNPEMARLIASAPEMLKALLEVVEVDDFGLFDDDTKQMVHNSIAKATGIEPTPDRV